MVEDALKANLDGFTLGDVIRFALPEFEFTFKSVLSSDALQKLQQILEKEGAPKIFADAAKRLSFQGIAGFMRGYIDLVFRSGDKYYILDYKSNRLGEDADVYDVDLLEKSMAENHYYLQYLIYTVAIYRYLKTRRQSYACFGGVFYLFLRGMEKGKGVYFDRQSERLILAFDKLLLGK
jgi:exodeoxyribonuclease V beta subunit